MATPRPILVALLFACTTANAQDAPYAPVRLAGHPVPTSAGEVSPAITKCDNCHAGYKEPRTDAGKALKSNEFILHDESNTWFTGDVHSIAFKSLDGPLGRQMGDRLGYKAADAPQCLACHSADTTPLKPLKDKKPDDFYRDDGGINCTVCHGMGKRWQEDHTDPPAARWREKDPRFKYDRGMADLRNPAVKAKLCVSCHVGNPDEGKVITHDMYAAGHPPLPPFELTNYMESEPKHWGYPSDSKLKYFGQFAAKHKEKPEETWKTFRYFPDDQESYTARHMVAGAVAVMEAEAALLEDAAKTGGGFDYARFDCSACHHHLTFPSARQKRGYDGNPPGRAPLKYWVGALPEVIAAHAGGGDLKAWAGEYGNGWPMLRKAAVAKQLGDPEQVSATAAKTRKWCNDYLQLQTDTAKPLYPPAVAKELLKALHTAAVSERWAGDTESALALAWASLGLRTDLKLPTPPEHLTGLGKVIPLQVRPPEWMADKKPVPIEGPKLNARLTQYAHFKPDEFVTAFNKLRE